MMKIALAQINPVVGDIEHNFQLMHSIILEARGKKIDLVVFPELAVTGYPPRDLLERRNFARRSAEAVGRLAALCSTPPRAVVGFVEPNPKETGKPFHNSAALLDGGRVAALYRKMLLPSYDVFDETRWFEPGESPVVFDLGGLAFGLTICEDIWSSALYGEKHLYKRDPVGESASLGARVILNISASPFTLKKRPLRRKISGEMARRCGVSILYCNQVGGNDDIIFDGGSFAVDRDESIGASGKEFEADLIEISLDGSGRVKGKQESPCTGDEAVLWKALKLGLRDYVAKCGQESVWIGLSGGIDSALVAALAAEALGSARVTCVSMPTRFSSKASIDDAQALAKNLGVRLITLPIESIFTALMDLLTPHFGGRPFDTAEENLQARIRGLLLMAFSNKLGGLVLATGNKSELATGYCTLYGDMVGAIAPIGDLYKTQVYALARHVNGDGEVIPGSIIRKAPSAELRPNQTDQDTLPPYDRLDAVLEMYLEDGMDLEAICGRGFDRDLVVRILGMLRGAEYKRNQAAIVLKVSERAFGSGRRYPIAQNYSEKPDESV
jgi:NAD+ synthase (glutamine-hydrolysing)